MRVAGPPTAHSADETGADTMAALTEALYVGNPVPPELNVAFLALLPKGSEEADNSGDVIRPAAVLRRLSIENIGSMAVAASATTEMHGPVRSCVHVAHRGFVPSRDLRHNVLELDGYGLVMALAAHGREVPLFLFSDIAAAFPSLGRAFLFAALEAVGGSPVAALCSHTFRLGGCGSLGLPRLACRRDVPSVVRSSRWSWTRSRALCIAPSGAPSRALCRRAPATSRRCSGRRAERWFLPSASRDER